MELVGTNRLQLTHETVMRLLEDAINVSRSANEKIVRVTDISRAYGSFGEWQIEVTTDAAQPVELREVSNG